MADENTQAEPNPDEKGLSPGVTTADLDEGQSRSAGAPQAPEVSNTPPPEEKSAEDKAKEAEAAKIEADAKAKEEADAKAKEEAEKAAEDENKEADEELTEYPEYGDEAADAAVSLLKEAGVTPAEADKFFREAVEANDLSKIDIAALTEKVGKDKASLIMMGVKDYYNRQMASTQESVDAVYGVVGGKENWDQVSAWARTKSNSDKAFASRMAELNQMFDLNKSAASMAARELVDLYNKDSNNKSLSVNMTHGDSSASRSGLGSEPLSRADYIEQLKAAEAKGDKAKVAELNARRLATKQQTGR